MQPPSRSAFWARRGREHQGRSRWKIPSIGYFSKITSYHDIVLELGTVVVVYNFVDILKTTFPW